MGDEGYSPSSSRKSKREGARGKSIVSYLSGVAANSISLKKYTSVIFLLIFSPPFIISVEISTDIDMRSGELEVLIGNLAFRNSLLNSSSAICALCVLLFFGLKKSHTLSISMSTRETTIASRYIINSEESNLGKGGCFLCFHWKANFDFRVKATCPSLQVYGCKPTSLGTVALTCSWRRRVQLVLKRILHEDGVVAFGAGGKQGNRRADKLFNVAHIAHGFGRQRGP